MKRPISQTLTCLLRPLSIGLPIVVMTLLFTGCATTRPTATTRPVQAGVAQGSTPAGDDSRSVPSAPSDTLREVASRLAGAFAKPDSTPSSLPRDIHLQSATDTTGSSPAVMIHGQPVNLQADTLTDDSLRVLREGMGQSTLLDSARASLLEGPGPTSTDTTAKEDADLDTSITYNGDELFFDVQRRTSIIRGRAKIVYKEMTLTAYEIFIDWQRDLMTAIPKLDTLWTDSTQTAYDSVKTVGMPTFVQKNQEMSGMLMRVNMKNREGYVEGGTTKYGDGFYRGKRIQKVTDDVFFIQGGMFTSCDAPEPHYKFTGSEMKMIRGDKVVGKPVVLRFGDVPVAALPFSVFSVKAGRHSGILIPTYGDDSNQGRNFQNLGYYWAASDYWDIKGMLDYFEESGFRVRGDLVYNKRYSFTGGTSASYKDEHNGKVYWDLRTRHRQTIDENTSLNVDGTFISSNDFYNTQTLSADQRLKQNITSNATFTHRWPNSGASLSLNLKQDRNLVTGANTVTLPSFSIGFGSKQLFPTAERKRASDKTLIYEPPQPRLEPGEERPEVEERWFNSITYTYRVNGSYTRKQSLADPNNYDTTLVESSDQGIIHNIGVSAPQHLFQYITVSPTLNYKEDWMMKRHRTVINPYGHTDVVEDRGLYRRFTFGAGVSANTKLYGMFPVQKWGIEMIRHVLTPSVGFSWRPDFSDAFWGYYQHLNQVYRDTTTNELINKEILYDQYQNTIAGGTPRGKQMAANFSLDNLFQMKTLTVDAQGKEQENKLDLFKANFSSSYNFAADSLKFSDLRSSFRADPIRGKSQLGPLKSLSLDLSATHSFYAYDPESNRVVNTYYWKRPGRQSGEFLRLVNASATASFSMEMGNPFTKRKAKIVVENAAQDTVDQEDELLKDIRSDFDNRFGGPEQTLQGVGKGAPLQVRGSLTYQLNKSNPLNVRETIFLRGSFSLKLTRNWSFNYSTGVDLKTRRVSVGTLSVGRDLHCWTGAFTWTPTGLGQGFYLRIGIKTPQLSDIKLEQRRGISGPTL